MGRNSDTPLWPPENNEPADKPIPNQALGKEKLTFYFGKHIPSKDGNLTPSNSMTRTLVAKRDIKDSPKETLEFPRGRDKGEKEDVSTKGQLLVDLLGGQYLKKYHRFDP
ncbi:hypothetical protein L6452_02109 [Arctium lappa]|uniref:Uncharacterized protein n=1 Tax=Arctium lappa TaxID=4217 RepID=A0ACB9FIX5_ARCLA|nr:hypothetical protein L6452_02109 [Arctium lappa]